MNIFNSSSIVIVLASIISISANAENSKTTNYEKLTSAMGYPYKLLIKRSDSIKIIYSESSDNINCKVIINWNEQEVQTLSKQVTKEKFNDKPLASCLARKEAKVILARTFE